MNDTPDLDLDAIEQRLAEGRIVNVCGEQLASRLCEKCGGGGCLPNAALGYLECDECGGAGMIHPDCAEQTYAELAAEVRRQRAALDAIRASLARHPRCDRYEPGKPADFMRQLNSRLAARKDPA